MAEKKSLSEIVTEKLKGKWCDGIALLELTDEDMQLISDMNKDTSSFFSHYDPATVEMICGLKR